MGKKSTNQHLRELLTRVLRAVEAKMEKRPDLVLAGWSEVIEERWRCLTTPVSYDNGILLVQVRGSSLYSWLVQQEKSRLLGQLQKKFPKAGITNIVFRIG